MSLILDALKKVQRKRTEESGIPTAFTTERRRRRTSPLRILYLVAAGSVLIFVLYLVLKWVPRYGSTIASPARRGRTLTQQAKRDVMEVEPQRMVEATEVEATKAEAKRPLEETVQERIPFEDFLPSPNLVEQMRKDSSTPPSIISSVSEGGDGDEQKQKEPSPAEPVETRHAVSLPFEVDESRQAEDTVSKPSESSASTSYLSAAEVAENAKSRLGVLRVLSGKYSDPMEQRIRDLVAKHQIELPMALALMRQESNLNTYAVSEEGAAGLCQIMPDTGCELGLNVPQYRDPQKPTADPTMDERFDPYRAMDVAFGYLRQLMDRYDGNVPLALSAYNAGMGRTKSRVARIRETTAYVSDIMTHYWRYQDEAALQQAMAQLVANIKAPPPAIEPETQKVDESGPVEDVVSKPSESAASIAGDSPLVQIQGDSPTPTMEDATAQVPTEGIIPKPSEPIEEDSPIQHPASSIQQEPSPTEPEAQKSDESGQAEKPTERISKIDLTTNKADYHFNLGVFHQSQGNSQKALEEYKEAVKLDPSNAQAHNNVGVIYKEMGLLDEAIQEYEKALSINPKYGKSLNNLGVALYLKGDLENAVKEFQKSAKVNPGDCAVYINLGLVFKKQGLIEDAVKTFQKALSIDPQYPEAYYNLGLTFEEIGETEKAIMYYKGFLRSAKGRYAALAREVERHIKGGKAR